VQAEARPKPGKGGAARAAGGSGARGARDPAAAAEGDRPGGPGAPQPPVRLERCFEFCKSESLLLQKFADSPAVPMMMQINVTSFACGNPGACCSEGQWQLSASCFPDRLCICRLSERCPHNRQPPSPRITLSCRPSRQVHRAAALGCDGAGAGGGAAAAQGGRQARRSEDNVVR